ncbi:hypothetical protein D9M68_382510 [compost metagenome]
MNIKIGRLLIFALLFSVFCKANLFAQTDTSIVVRLMLVQKFDKQNNKLIAAVSVTFVNTTDHDIYIPGIFNKSRLYPTGGKVKTFVKAGDRYKPDGYYGKAYPEPPYNGGGIPGSFIINTKNAITEKYANVEKIKLAQQDSILAVFAKASPVAVKRDGLEPLFLKAHEAYEMNLIKDMNYLITLPGEYKLFYEQAFSLPNVEHYPEKVLSYERFMPKGLISNILYLKVEP